MAAGEGGELLRPISPLMGGEMNCQFSSLNSIIYHLCLSPRSTRQWPGLLGGVPPLVSSIEDFF